VSRWLHFIVVEHWRPAAAGCEELGYVREGVDLIDIVPPMVVA
jgi:hypothetical protein